MLGPEHNLEPKPMIVDNETVRSLIALRMAARDKGDFQLADQLRAKLYFTYAITLDDSNSSWMHWNTAAAATIGGGGGCCVWLRGRNGEPGSFCSQSRAAESIGEETMELYCEKHRVEQHGRVPCPVDPKHTVPFGRLHHHACRCAHQQRQRERSSETPAILPAPDGNSDPQSDARRSKRHQRTQRAAARKRQSKILAARLAAAQVWPDDTYTTDVCSGRVAGMAGAHVQAGEDTPHYVIHVAGGLEFCAVKDVAEVQRLAGGRRCAQQTYALVRSSRPPSLLGPVLPLRAR